MDENKTIQTEVEKQIGNLVMQIIAKDVIITKLSAALAEAEVAKKSAVEEIK